MVKIMTEVVLTKEAEADVLSLPEVKRELLVASLRNLKKSDYQELDLSKESIQEKDVFVKSIDNHRIFMSQQRNPKGKFTLIILRIVSDNEVVSFVKNDLDLHTASKKTDSMDMKKNNQSSLKGIVNKCIKFFERTDSVKLSFALFMLVFSFIAIPTTISYRLHQQNNNSSPKIHETESIYLLPPHLRN
jgi:hypothetical protein